MLRETTSSSTALASSAAVRGGAKAPMTVRSCTRCPEPHDGAPMGVKGAVHGGRRLQTWIFTAVDALERRVMSNWHVCKRGDRFAALQPISMGLAGLHLWLDRGPASARGLALRDGSRLRPTYLSDGGLHATRSSSGASSRPGRLRRTRPCMTNGRFAEPAWSIAR